MLNFEIIRGILLPFAGTTLGAACVFFMKKGLHAGVQRALTGFAAGVMVAAFRLEPSDPGARPVRPHGKMGIYPGGCRIFARYGISASP